MAGDATNNSQSPALYLSLPVLKSLLHIHASSLFLISESRATLEAFLEDFRVGGTMDGGGLPERRTGSVRAAVSSYRERILESNPTIKKLQTNYPEKPYMKTRELHQAKRDTNQLKESRKLAELVADEANSELSAARKTVKDLTLRIEESNSRAEEQTRDLEKLKMGGRKEGECESGNSQCESVMRELEKIKRELSKLKLDMATVMEEKRRAEKETEESLSKSQSYLSSIEELNKKIEEVNEEHVLVELARIEAIKECEEIEVRRREESEVYRAAIEETRRRKESMVEEIEDVRELETKLAMTVSDVNMLDSELKQVKELEKGLERNESTYQEEDESGSVSLLESVLKELEETTKELAEVKDESFQFMSSMDVVRNELRHVAEETARLRKKEEKSEMTIQNLNSKLLRAKAKLESTSAAEDKAKSMLSNLSATLEQIKSEAETAEKERSLISEETAVVKAEIQRTETEIDLAEERLQAALEDLKAVKSAEAIALENLKVLIEKTMRNRASASRPSSTITISKFEYEYLTGHAAGAKEIADKKVAAAQAWIEALKASEKEIQIKSELVRRETRELKMEEECDVPKPEGSTNANKMVENEYESWRERMEPGNMKLESAFPSKATNRSVKMTPSRRGKGRRSASPIIRATPRSTSFTVGRRTKVMPKLAKIFTGKSID
ncbi:protein PLASTID MOVEMENT IMPAIRED 2 [Sesamum alatum]|uniref:Protein PLASTID MOVEMENT IMPAIRED 2 n=1 Tax=Sesamum alatum TaxID=300844 RepID=A0AAE2CC05_9LAMI|nr:protein PLASTID MOVEMENT IMPAIRED 2 [Sesamum alatum]